VDPISGLRKLGSHTTSRQVAFDKVSSTSTSPHPFESVHPLTNLSRPTILKLVVLVVSRKGVVAYLD